MDRIEETIDQALDARTLRELRAAQRAIGRVVRDPEVDQLDKLRVLTAGEQVAMMLGTYGLGPAAPTKEKT